MYMYYLLGHRLMELPIHVKRKEVIAKNTFILALDGDIDFKPEAVHLLIDLMKKDEKLGAACGRIHPVGNGKPTRDPFLKPDDTVLSLDFRGWGSMYRVRRGYYDFP
jgi:hypothetical protein